MSEGTLHRRLASRDLANLGFDAPLGFADLGDGVSGPEAKKSQESLEEVSLTLESAGTSFAKPPFLGSCFFFFRTFGTPGRDFLALGPETHSPRPTEPQHKCARMVELPTPRGRPPLTGTHQANA